MAQRALTELLRGMGAHVDPVACVEDISAEVAGREVAGFPHSIGQLLFHMNYWMDYELRRIRGERPVYPEHSEESFPPTTAMDAEEWERQRKRFEVLLGVYNSYHAGQIAMMRQVLGAWPPRGGGDSW